MNTSNIIAGFKINSIEMRDGETGQVVWSYKGAWDLHRTVEAHIPKAILQCKSVARKINFSSLEAINSFRLVQKISLQNQHLEEWRFNFGFVIPNSTNDWEQIIYADEAHMLPAEVLSGNVLISTQFFDGDALIHESNVRLFYD